MYRKIILQLKKHERKPHKSGNQVKKSKSKDRTSSSIKVPIAPI